MKQTATIMFPEFSGTRCLMMPFIQGDPESVPSQYQKYSDILSSLFLKKGDIGYLTIDECNVEQGSPQRASRAKYARALHTEAGKDPNKTYHWGGNGGGWGKRHRVTLDADVEILLANNLDNTCALWDAEHQDTSIDGDIGNFAEFYPYSSATMMQAGEVFKIGILTPHESLPVSCNIDRQFLRIVSSGVYGRENYFTKNPLL